MSEPNPVPDLHEAMIRRKSVRGFQAKPVPQAQLRTLFETAQRSPSWCNVQPWRVAITAPPLTAQVTQALTSAATTGVPNPDVAFPSEYPEPHLSHRRACGVALYQAMGIERNDKQGRHAAWLRNYAAFDAPHLAVVSQDRRLGQYGTLDIGVWLGLFIAAAALMDIGTCPMASVAAYPGPLRELLAIPNEESILVGIAIGYEDANVAANSCRTTREPLDSNVRFLGF